MNVEEEDGMKGKTRNSNMAKFLKTDCVEKCSIFFEFVLEEEEEEEKSVCKTRHVILNAGQKEIRRVDSDECEGDELWDGRGYRGSINDNVQNWK